MVKSRNTKGNTNDTPDFLVKDKTQFQQELEDRIIKGEELINRAIQSTNELSKLNEEFNYWHDYNAELLSRAFNKAKNKYYNDYTWSPSVGIGYINVYKSREPSLEERIQSVKKHIAEYVTRLKKIKEKVPLIEKMPGINEKEKKVDVREDALLNLKNLFEKFHKVAQSLRDRYANRDTLIIKDEFDMHDLLHALLKIYFNDVRNEDYAPSDTGSNSKIDFILKSENIAIEIKMTNEHLADKEIGNQLLIDIGRYKSHPNCGTLVIFVYDKGDYIRNKIGLIRDLENKSTNELKIKVFVEPN